MYSNRKYSLREKLAFLRHYIISKVSLFYLRFINGKKVTFIRDGGIGDAIMSTAIIAQYKKENPYTQINLSVLYPVIYKLNGNVNLGGNAFPRIRLSYGHHDLKWFSSSSMHFKEVMAEMAGLRERKGLANEIDEEPFSKTGRLANCVECKNFAVIQPEAGEWFPEKNWTNDRWEEFVSRLSLDFDRIYQIGLVSEEKINGTVDLRGELSVAESIHLIKQSNFFFGVSSFGEQVAGTYNVPSVIIYGPTHPVYALNEGQVAVYGKNRDLHWFGQDLPQYDFPSMADVEVEDAYFAFGKMKVSLV